MAANFIHQLTQSQLVNPVELQTTQWCEPVSPPEPGTGSM
jgi:hypothetical protein